MRPASTEKQEPVPEGSSKTRSATTPPQGVFVRIPKTASTSIESVLGEFQHVLLNSQSRILPQENGTKHWEELGLARLWRQTLGAQAWNNSFTFTFVRCPYDRAVSSWQHVSRLFRTGDKRGIAPRHRSRVTDLSFDAFLWLVEEGALTGQAKWHSTPQSVHVIDETGRIMIDFLGRFERLQDGFDHVCATLSIPRHQLPHLRKSKSRVNQSDYYNRSRRVVAERIYAQDFELLDYALCRGG
jgi:chondroitin 4-sulfotransferase 11